MSRRKWWQIPDLSEDEKDLFLILARNPEYKWRSAKSLCDELGWGQQKFQDICLHHIKKTKTIVVRKTQDGRKQIAYWENVKELLEDDPNEDKISRVLKRLGKLKPVRATP